MTINPSHDEKVTHYFFNANSPVPNCIPSINGMYVSSNSVISAAKDIHPSPYNNHGICIPTSFIKNDTFEYASVRNKTYY